MNIEEIKQLVQLMVDNELSELDITDGQKKIALKRGAGALPVPAAQAAPPAGPGPPAVPAAPPGEEFVEIKSPMVGTLYAAPSPDSEPFVQAGTTVSDETTVCIVEAMKVMNEIKAEVDGTIVEVLVTNGQAVEYGQVLFKVKPN